MSGTWLLPVAGEAYRSRKELSGIWDRISARILGKKSRIAITGAKGVGKTVLHDHLVGKAFRQGYTPPEHASQWPEKGTAWRDRKRLALVVAPGEDAPGKWETLDQVFNADDPFDGIVHVLSGGFVTIRNKTARDELIQSGLKTTLGFLEEQRKAELDELVDVCGRVRGCLRTQTRPSWLILAIAKADLYYESLDQQRAYYSHNATNDVVSALNSVREKVGKDRFRWTVAPVCSWLEHFEWNGEITRSKLLPAQRDHYLASFAELLEQHCANS